MRTWVAAMAVGFLLGGVGAVVRAADGVSGTEVSEAFLQGPFHFGVSVEGGSNALTWLVDSTNLVRVVVRREERFLVVEAAGTIDTVRPGCGTVFARYPYESRREGLAVRWGDDPTPFTMELPVGPDSSAVFASSGPCDVADLSVDEAAGHVTFVRRMALTSSAVEGSRTRFVRTTLLKERAGTFEPAVQEEDAPFGYFTADTTVVARKETGLLADVALRCRLDLAKRFVYEVHPDVPAVCHEPIRAAVESWNDVFEARCGVRPLAVRDGRRDQVPGDLRHNLIFFRFGGYDDEGGCSAYAPCVALASTGEIVGGDVVVDGTLLMGQLRALEGSEAQAEAPSGAATEAAQGEAAPTARSEAVRRRGGVGRLCVGGAELPPVQNTPDEFRTRRHGTGGAAAGAGRSFALTVQGLICHELGHTLGLRHNFAASADHANLASGEVATSIMDYCDYGPRCYLPGPYDAAAIAWGYGGTLRAGEESRFIFETDGSVSPLAAWYDEGDPFDFYRGGLEPLLETLRAGKKPTGSAASARKEADYALRGLRRFIGSGHPHDDEAMGYFLEVLGLQFSTDARYRAKAHLSAVRTVAAQKLAGLPNDTGRTLTRRRHALVMEGIGAAVADAEGMLEADRLALVGILKEANHASARTALRSAKEAIDQRLGQGLGERAAQVEENVLMRVEQALAASSSWPPDCGTGS